jgi:hypothetical protein
MSGYWFQRVVEAFRVFGQSPGPFVRVSKFPLAQIVAIQIAIDNHHFADLL